MQPRGGKQSGIIITFQRLGTRGYILTMSKAKGNHLRGMKTGGLPPTPGQVVTSQEWLRPKGEGSRVGVNEGG